VLDLQPGQKVRRVELHDTYGGRRQGGISPSRVTPNVFIFTDPVKGALHGYVYDGWRDDKLFHYTGEGQFGDQQMAQGNKALRDHGLDDRELHLFEVATGVATYVDQFDYVDHYYADAPETSGGPIRSVIVFRLKPRTTDPSPAMARVQALGRDSIKEVPVEQHFTEKMVIDPNREPYEAERREQRLVRSFMAHLITQGHEVCRLQFLPPDEPAPIFCDLYDKTSNAVVEAKGSVARPAIRMALGQLADYARLVGSDPRRVILVPEKPRPDLVRLAESQDAELVWPQDGTFTGTHSLR
jgi:hypothetical protein